MNYFLRLFIQKCVIILLVESYYKIEFGVEFMYQEIKNLIRQKNNNLDEQTLTYFTNYFYILVKVEVKPAGIRLEDLIDNALKYASKIEFYNEHHKIYLENGGDTKGLRDSETKTIFIRDNLPEPLREMTVYHELHHAAQTNPENDMVGINQESNIGRLIMEAQAQYFAEKIYQEIHGIQFEEREILSEALRMLENGVVVSSLHNYEMYDNLLSKLAIILNVSKDYFVSINYLYKDNVGLKDLEQKYNEVREKLKLPYDFNSLLLIFDYIYCVDLLAYKKNDDREIILSGQETENVYEIHPNQGLKMSLKKQRDFLNQFDVDYFLALEQNGGNFIEFSRFVVDNEKRALIEQFVGTYSEQPQTESPKNKY